MSNWYPASGGAGNIGDMTKAVYDAQGLVETTGGIPDYVKAKLDELKLDLGSIASIKVVDAQPTNPVRNTLYYVGTENPYHVWLYANGEWYDMGTTAVNLDGYAKTEDVEQMLLAKQNALSAEELAAVQSGITGAKVTAYDGYGTGKADVGLDNVTNAAFKKKVETCGLDLPLFEYKSCTFTNKVSGLTPASSRQCKISDKLYFFEAYFEITARIESGYKPLCKISSLPTGAKGATFIALSNVLWGSYNRVETYLYSDSNILYAKSDNGLSSGNRLFVSGLVLYS